MVNRAGDGRDWLVGDAMTAGVMRKVKEPSGAGPSDMVDSASIATCGQWLKSGHDRMSSIAPCWTR